MGNQLILKSKMKFFAVACLLSATSAITLNDPNWGPSVNSLPHCPDFDERFTLTDGKTRAVPYPQVGFNCNNEYQLAQQKAHARDIASDIAVLPHCPDFDERMTLNDGKTLGVPYPQKGYNCNAEYALSQHKK